MKVNQVQQQLKEFSLSGKKMFVSSSFQTHSIPLLHIISTSGINVDVLFINTGFHFPETIIYKDEIASKLGIDVIDVRSHVPKSQQRDSENQFYFVTDPDYCCFLNKTQPMDPYLMRYDIWISGVRAEQSAVRKAMKTIQAAPYDTIRYHPMLGWTAKDIFEYRKKYNLPEHPLDAKGYQSIGCAPCTRKLDLNDERSARWFGMNKSECGLHTQLISK